jgi:aryl-alcohol dehydrogenase-like predicted oxidoreductase
MRTRTIGDVTVSAIGLGAMPLSVGAEGVAHDQAMRTIHAALDAGVRLIDTADAYTLDGTELGHNEHYVAEALATWSGDADGVLVATKGGSIRTPGGGWDQDGSPEHMRAACEASLKRLGVERIGLYQHHRPDPSVPYAETIGALADLVSEGKIHMVGISNADAAQIREAAGIVELASVQNQFSPASRDARPEIALCDEMGVAFLPYSPLGGMGGAADLGSQQTAFAEVGEAHGVSPQQVALAWELAQSDVVVPIPGASRPETILDSLQAADLQLSGEELARLDTT